jgi:xanthine dehydrogenase accessory factor
MRLDILRALNAERAARRGAIVVTNVESGAQRLVKAADVAADPLREILEARLRSGKSGPADSPEGRVFLSVHVPPTKLVITGAVHISQALAPIARILGYDVTIVDPRTAFATKERFPDVPVIGHRPAAAQRRPLHRVRRAHPRSQDRRSGAAACARPRLFLHRRARVEENARP